MIKQLAGLALAGATLFGASVAQAVAITDVQEYSNNTATEFFVKNDASKTQDPYYRGPEEDWGWTHNAIAGSFTSIELDISAFDVDTPREKDRISVFNGSTWTDIGILAGQNNIWEFTTFDLMSYAWAETQVNAGLQVRMDISEGSSAWAVTLGKATLTLDGGSQACVPTPGVPCTPTSVPEPSGLALLGLGLAGLGFARRKQAKKS